MRRWGPCPSWRARPACPSPRRAGRRRAPWPSHRSRRHRWGRTGERSGACSARFRGSCHRSDCRSGCPFRPWPSRPKVEARRRGPLTAEYVRAAPPRTGFGASRFGLASPVGVTGRTVVSVPVAIPGAEAGWSARVGQAADDGDRRRGHAATRRAAGAEPDRPDPPPGVRAPEPGSTSASPRGSGRRRTSRCPRSCSSSSTVASSTRRGTSRSCGSSGKSIVEIETVFDVDGRRRAEEQTVEAMRSGVDVVYQGTFFDGAWGGQADFLLKVPGRRTSATGLRDRRHQARPQAQGRRAAADGDLRRAADASCRGSSRSASTSSPATASARPWRLVDVAAYARRARARLETFVADAAGHRARRRSATASSAAGRRCATASCAPPTTSAWSPSCAATTATRCLPQASRPWRPWRRRRRSSWRESGIGVDAAHPAAAAGSRAAEGAHHRPDPPARCSTRSPASGCCGSRRPAPATCTSTSRATPGSRTATGIEYLAGLGDTTGALHPALGARPRRREADGRRPHRPAGRRRRRPTRTCTSTTTRPTR